MRIVITGASGLIGRTFASQMLEGKHEIVVLGRDVEKLNWLFPDPYIRVQCEYDQRQLIEIFKGSQAIVHLAARRVAPEENGFWPFYEANIRVTEAVINAAGQAGVPCVCQASSLSVYSSRNTIPFKETEPAIPASLYGISKLACEHIGMLAQNKYKNRVVALRIAGVIGYGDISGEGFMRSKFIQMARQKQPLPIYGEGISARDQIYIKDVTSAIERVLMTDTASGIYNIGSNHPPSVRELAEAINQEFDNAGNLFFDRSKEENKQMIYMDCSRAEHDLNWKPVWSLSMGLREIRKAYNAESEE